MKKAFTIFISAVILFSVTACTTDISDPVTTETSPDNRETTDKSIYDSINDDPSFAGGKYEIAFITDIGQLKDKSFNQGTWDAIKYYAHRNGKTYKYYQPVGGDNTTDEDRYDTIKAAAHSGAKIIVCAGSLQGTALQKSAIELTNVKFIFIDGWVLTDKEGTPLKNVAAIDFKEEQSGYLAGYAAVREGYRNLGFIGGGGGTNASCCRYGYGYIQGAQTAAEEKEITVTLNFSWEYGSNFSASPELQTMISGWYSQGTQVVFVCGGGMCQSVFAAASANDGAVIGVDVDQSEDSDTVITSATKEIRSSVIDALEKAYSGLWDEMGGRQTTLGAESDAVCLPTDTWRLENFTVKEYNRLLNEIKKGYIEIDRDYENGLKDENFPNVKLNII